MGRIAESAALALLVTGRGAGSKAEPIESKICACSGNLASDAAMVRERIGSIYHSKSAIVKSVVANWN